LQGEIQEILKSNISDYYEMYLAGDPGDRKVYTK
jgi:hypothetical protein